MIARYPFTAAANARPKNFRKKKCKSLRVIPIPVLPLVGSMSVYPCFSVPLASASSIILSAILSLTDPPALKKSHFAYTLHVTPSACGMRFKRTSGVFPICPNIESSGGGALLWTVRGLVNF